MFALINPSQITADAGVFDPSIARLTCFIAKTREKTMQWGKFAVQDLRIWPRTPRRLSFTTPNDTFFRKLVYFDVLYLRSGVIRTCLALIKKNKNGIAEPRMKKKRKKTWHDWARALSYKTIINITFQKLEKEEMCLLLMTPREVHNSPERSFYWSF